MRGRGGAKESGAAAAAASRDDDDIGRESRMEVFRENSFSRLRVLRSYRLCEAWRRGSQGLILQSPREGPLVS
jgi:hypothetical protein